jgi:hypothetical protein
MFFGFPFSHNIPERDDYTRRQIEKDGEQRERLNLSQFTDSITLLSRVPTLIEVFQ